MMFITEKNTHAINDYLQTKHVACNYNQVLNFIKETEARFNKDQIPDTFRIGVSCSKIWSTPEGAYSFTVKRLPCGYWALTCAAFTSAPTRQQRRAHEIRAVVPI